MQIVKIIVAQLWRSVQGLMLKALSRACGIETLG